MYQDIQLKNSQPIIANIIKENVGFLAIVRIILDLLRRSTWLTFRMGNPLRLVIFLSFFCGSLGANPRKDFIQPSMT
jgi:hypothetical protein